MNDSGSFRSLDGGEYDPAGVDVQTVYVSEWSMFTLRICAGAEGAVLRRTFVHTLNQEARVEVDGVFAGIWHTPGSNPFLRLADDDFWIREQFTKGKTLLRIKVRHVLPVHESR